MTALSKETIDTVKATIPFLAENATKLTAHFYQRMFRENPEVKVYFNAAHQISGGQQGALAASVCAFARNIETPENLAAAVSLIANKHASLGVQPEHYPIVGKHLLASIDELLNPAPPEILQAWGEAYGFLAEVLIQQEKGIYAEQSWNGFRKFTLFRKEEESAVVSSFYLKPSDGGTVPAYLPGQYITVRIPTADGSTTMRNYSLSCHGCQHGLRISVKQEKAAHADQPDGYVSNYLHEQLALGDEVEVAPPCGDFVFDADAAEKSGAPVLLLSGGIGITPLLSMLHASKGKSFPVSFVHGAIDSKHHSFAEEVRKLVQEHENIRVHFRYSAPLDGDSPDSQGLFDREFLCQYLSPDTEVYFCGPKPMMAHVLNVLDDADHPADKVHYEFFGPAEELIKCPMHTV